MAILWIGKMMGFLQSTALMVIFMSSAIGAGELSWENPSDDVSVSPADEQVTAKFSFRNNSAAKIEIQRVISTCDCVTAQASRLRIEPGESGEIHAVLTVGNRKGLQVKKIVVENSPKKG